MPTPPRPPPRPALPPPESAPITQRTGSIFDLPRAGNAEPPPKGPEPLAELDAGTRALLSDAIAKAVAAELGNVRVSSVPPSAPRSSLRVAAASTSKVGKWGTMAIGALAVAGQVIVWFGKPEYAGPIAQALKLIASLITSAAGGGAPSAE
jgi:hypothetical protein